MYPLNFGGRSRIGRILAGGTAQSWISNLITTSPSACSHSACRRSACSLPVRRLSARGFLAGAVLVAGISTAAGASAEIRTDGAGSFQPAFFSSGLYGSDENGRHWTLREPTITEVSTATRVSSTSETVASASNGASSGASTGSVVSSLPGRAEVSMFSWRDIVVAAFLAAFALGALFALTRGGEQRPTRHL